MLLIRGFLSAVLLSLGTVHAALTGAPFQEAPQPKSDQTTELEGPAEAAELPRVVGQARTPEEWEAWQLVERSARLADKAGLAESFLRNYPDSGLTSNAHYIIARNYYQLGDRENFVIHAEEALEELPNSPDLLAQLSFFYAESGQAAQAIDRGNRAIDVIDRVDRPAEVSVSQWVDEVYQIKAEANYAVGRAYLSRMSRTENRAEDPNLKTSIEHLKVALRYDPRHDYACFRLGFAERNANNAGGALMAYGRAVAIGGVAAEPAQSELQDVHTIVKESMPDSEWAEKSPEEIIDQASVELEESVAETQAEKSHLILELERQAEEEQLRQDEPSGASPRTPDMPAATER